MGSIMSFPSNTINRPQPAAPVHPGASSYQKEMEENTNKLKDIPRSLIGRL